MILIIAAEKPSPRVVEAEEFVLRGKDGKARARLAVEQDVALFHLYGTDGKTIRFVAAARKDHTVILLNDQQEKRKLEFQAGESSSIIRAYGADRKIRLDCCATPEKSHITLCDKDGVVCSQWLTEGTQSELGFWHDELKRFQVSVNGKETKVLLGNKKGKGQIGLSVQEGGAGIGLSDEHESMRTEIKTTEEGCKLILYDGQKRVRAQLGIEENPLLRLLDKDGKSLFSKP